MYKGQERRQFIRLDYISPLAYKVCHKETLSKLLEGYIVNISQSGLLCNLKDSVNIEDILWLCFDRTTLKICEELEKRSLIYQNGIIGKVVRTRHKQDGSYEIGVRFLTREEKNLTNIYPKIHFLKGQIPEEIEEEEEEELAEESQQEQEQEQEQEENEEI